MATSRGNQLAQEIRRKVAALNRYAKEWTRTVLARSDRQVVTQADLSTVRSRGRGTPADR